MMTNKLPAVTVSCCCQAWQSVFLFINFCVINIDVHTQYIYSEADYVFKIVFIGDVNVGKSCTIDMKIAQNVVKVDEYTPTLKTASRECVNEYYWILPKKKIKLVMYDTPGQESDESFNQNTGNHYKEADGIIICYDITKKESFENINNWLQKINKYNSECTVMIAGNKLDLQQDRKVSNKEAQV